MNPREIADQAWRWPLRSRTRFVITIAVLIAAIIVWPQPARQPTSAPPPAATTPATAGPATPGDRATAAAAAEGDEAGLEDQGAAARAAAAFVDAWSAKTTPAAWRAGVKPLCDPEFYTQLASVDPARISATRATGTPRVAVFNAGRAVYIVATDADPVQVTEIYDGHAWVVTDITAAAAR